jgi:hypothetical protein
VRSWPAKLETPGSSAAASASTLALPPSAAASSNAVMRTDMSLTLSFDFTVAMALPA